VLCRPPSMTGVYRLLQHHTDYMLTEHKQLLQHLMVHVKNLRSQVGHKEGCQRIAR